MYSRGTPDDGAFWAFKVKIMHEGLGLRKPDRVFLVQLSIILKLTGGSGEGAGKSDVRLHGLVPFRMSLHVDFPRQ